MKSSRAKAIAESFSRISSFAVENRDKGVCVHYRDNHAYFIREACFWSFVFRLGYAGHEEGQIAEIEAELTA
ncbi:hypothetical protein Ga0123462_0075 [Mariprofundus ferrinatatus]|uniref:Uncharacterized protein n=1 Tax=Mariprofundus ferrinatatus TaxID=1921087 RepID=A0A2K8L7N2_9PROT|nr:hypothetical protein [Mariprofundus ferrinatatus]ATX80954.1 hypothetical protein Ga0123462_0075 [Mariprofundus ferrinatatus]